MSIANDFINIIQYIEKHIDIPPIKEIYFPSPERDPHKKNNFGAIQLDDGSVGIIYMSISPEIKLNASKSEKSRFIGKNPSLYAKKFSSLDYLEKTIAMGAINAISQFVFKHSNFEFNYTSDSLGLLNLNGDDKVGMIGFFPPLVNTIKKLKIPLVVLELREQLVKKTESYEVTLNPNKLIQCNKILCTSTTVLNDTIDNILKYTSNAQKFSLVGPSAGFLPDPVFNKGINVIGGTFVCDPELFFKLISENRKWDESTRKYVIIKEKYPGFEELVKNNSMRK